MTEVAESVAGLRSLVSPLVGPVLGACDLLLSPEEPDYHVVVAFTAPHGRAGSRSPIRGMGAGTTRDEAFAAAVGEAIERYAAACLPEEELVLASARDLGDEALDPERFCFYQPDQLASRGFPAVPFTRDTVVRWVRGVDLASGDDVYVPAQLVYWSSAASDEPTIGAATSNGLACAGSFAEAALAGLLELIERDAFSILWANRLSLPLLELDGIESSAWQKTGLRYAAVDLSSFWDVPCALGVVRSDSRRHAPLGLGGGCALNAETAVAKAMREAFFTISMAQSLQEANPDRVFADDGSDVLSFDDHVQFYADRRRAGRAKFLDAATERRPLADVGDICADDPEAALDALVRRLAARDACAYAVDITPVDVADAGLAVARVVAPELCPLDLAHRARHTGNPRLYEEPVRLGLRETAAWPGALNPDPHPFP